MGVAAGLRRWRPSRFDPLSRPTPIEHMLDARAGAPFTIIASISAHSIAKTLEITET
jgi:hypothetical protein